VFVREQARALRAAGADVTLFCYGTGEGPAPPDLSLVTAPAVLSPAALRAGPSLGKPLADALLARRLAAAARSARLDAVLAHNVEAGVAALLVRARTRVPVVYVAHTLLAAELDAYLPRKLAPLARRAGAALDCALAAAADAVIALSHEGARRLAPHARGPVEVIPPGLDPAPPPDLGAVRRACQRAGVDPGHFALYTGNVDAYQDLELLAGAARLAPELPIVVATHGERRMDAAGVRCLRATVEEARALTFACGVALLPRRRPGGFPIKLLNYMEAARAIVAHADVADGLVHGRSGWLLPPGSTATAWAEALRALHADPQRAAVLGRAARDVLETRHAWPALARRTLELARSTRREVRPIPSL
jgi:glycosyltransferase involved in cell wall biosynthesis